jgi:hypothetical protein
MSSSLIRPFFFSIATMEAKIIQKFFPELISAVGACVQTVSDHCLSKGLIEDTTRTKVLALESAVTEKDKTRILMCAVRDTVARNPTCFNVFITVLEKVLPSVDDPLLKAMKAAVTSEVEHVSPPKFQITSDSDTCQLRPTSDPSSKSDFIHNRHHDQALKWPEELDSVSDSVFSEGATTSCIFNTGPKTALESSATQLEFEGEYQVESNQDVEVSCSAWSVTVSVS